MTTQILPSTSRTCRGLLWIRTCCIWWLPLWNPVIGCKKAMSDKVCIIFLLWKITFPFLSKLSSKLRNRLLQKLMSWKCTCFVTGRSSSSLSKFLISLGFRPAIFLLIDIMLASRHTLVISAPEYPESFLENQKRILIWVLPSSSSLKRNGMKGGIITKIVIR